MSTHCEQEGMAAVLDCRSARLQCIQSVTQQECMAAVSTDGEQGDMAAVSSEC